MEAEQGDSHTGSCFAAQGEWSESDGLDGFFLEFLVFVWGEVAFGADPDPGMGEGWEGIEDGDGVWLEGSDEVGVVGGELIQGGGEVLNGVEDGGPGIAGLFLRFVEGFDPFGGFVLGV